LREPARALTGLMGIAHWRFVRLCILGNERVHYWWGRSISGNLWEVHSYRFKCKNKNKK
jgi:hypothetical protein